MSNKAIDYIESSFLKDLIMNKNITDISFNGETIFYVDNELGRKKSNIVITNDEAIDFIRQIANYTEKQFSFVEPILDVSFGRYRLNAIHQSIGRLNNEKVINFSIRIASLKNRIISDSGFMSNEMKLYLNDLIKNKKSIMIAGETGSGKTELQKYLLSTLKDNSRIILIDNLEELENLRTNPNIDLNSWQVGKSNAKSFEDLIANALRCNPDWLIVSEARGKEMSSMLTSVMSGHPLISTIHAYNIEEIPHRICRLIMQESSNQKYEDIFIDVINHITNYIFVKKYVDNNGKVIRYISDISLFNKENMKMDIIFHVERS
ncbi:MAG TPA: hypothetical protein DDW20_03225 [Firmicutes bacterium]|nr:hypothetical protein [Bacillota bacterium]